MYLQYIWEFWFRFILYIVPHWTHAEHRQSTFIELLCSQVNLQQIFDLAMPLFQRNSNQL